MSAQLAVSPATTSPARTVLGATGSAVLPRVAATQHTAVA